ncbi:hypothetical protein OG596_26470 [Streptomyces sp. NBC_01102]|uniref:hypothetical protein n=1 Tax=Streptomyces sp. NBC_01102 TaxID=2903749 RepID=UPI0038657C49|nr:hypothetical protein OG596_26470 [Streptomyces sp. NBC_01102]
MPEQPTNQAEAERNALAKVITSLTGQTLDEVLAVAHQIVAEEAPSCAPAPPSDTKVEQLRATVRRWLPILGRALDCLDTTCRYHGANTDPDHVGREACCDTGVEPHRHAAAAVALAALTELATTEA